MKNYKPLLMFVLHLLVERLVMAQLPVDIGFKAGISTPGLTTHGNESPINGVYGTHTEAVATIDIEVHFNRQFSIQPQLAYSSQGDTYNGNQAVSVPVNSPSANTLYAKYNSITQINYLMLPPLAKYTAHFKHGWEGYIVAVPLMSNVLTTEYTTSGTGNVFVTLSLTQKSSTIPLSFTDNVNIKGSAQPWSIGFVQNIGLAHNLKGNSKLVVEADESFGTTTLQRNGVTGKYRTDAAVFNAGYQFRLFPTKNKMSKTVEAFEMETSSVY